MGNSKVVFFVIKLDGIAVKFCIPHVNVCAIIVII